MQVPLRPSRVEFGVGIDSPARKDPRIGDEASRDALSACIDAFLERHADELGRLFVCWQPRDWSWLGGIDPVSTYDELFDRMAPFVTAQALHHGALNLATLEPYERGDLVELANALVHRHAFSWVNEDLALGSVGGKPLPYPLPPYLTDDGLRAAIENTNRVSRDLAAPVLIEFPGFADGAAFFIGPIHAYDFFRVVAESADVAVTLDAGHLLSYQWLLGRRGTDLFRDLERLPLDRCFEIRLSGCEIADGRFYGRHHGLLLDEEIELLDRLLERCTNVRAVTYEEPLFCTDRRSNEAAAEAVSEIPPARPFDEGPMSLEHALYALLYRRRAREALLLNDAERLGVSSKELAFLATVDRDQLERAARLVTEGVLSRAYQGDRTLLEAYPRTIEAWRRANPRRTLADLAADFAESPHFEAYRAVPTTDDATSLEEAFFRFCEQDGIADRVTRKAECARAVIRTLVATPAPSFRLPDFVMAAPKGHFAIVEEDDGTTLFAAIEHRLVTGRITPFLAVLLASREPPSLVAIRFDVSTAELAASCTVLRRMGLLA